MKNLLLVTLLFFSTNILIAQWVPITPPPNNFRTDHSFGFALNDVGYLVAGTNNSISSTSADFYSYNSITDQWTQLNDFPGGTRGFGIGEIHGGKAYFGFGRGNSPGQVNQQRHDLWEFDPATGVWTELSPCPGLVRLHPAMVAVQGKIYVGCGSNSTVGNLKDWWEYDIATDNWTQKTDFPGFRRHHPYQFALGNKVYVGFGHGSLGSQIYKDMYEYDPATDIWTQVSDITGEARVAGTQFSHNGFGYALSGDGQTHTSMSIGEFWRYDATNDSWFQMPSHPGQSRWAPASFVINDEVYLINGAITPAYSYPNTSYKFNLNGPLGLDEATKENQFSIYPNPFNSEFSIDLSNLEEKENLNVKVFNALGKIVLDRQLGNDLTSIINLETLENGLYWVEISSVNEKIGASRIIKAD